MSPRDGPALQEVALCSQLVACWLRNKSFAFLLQLCGLVLELETLTFGDLSEIERHRSDQQHS